MSDCPPATMIASEYETELYTSETYAEGAGTVLFRLATREVCVLRSRGRDERVLPRGRRRVGEAPGDAAVRETAEETGFSCRLLPVNMVSWALPPGGDPEPEQETEIETEIDEPRIHKGVCEPIGLQLRREDDIVELVWWFVAAVNEGEPRSRRHEERERERPGVGFLSYEDALATLTSADDRALVEKAIAVVNATQVSQKSRAATICFGQPK